MKVYIAAPYTKGDVAQNVHNAIKTANILIDMGHIPYIPHLTHFWHLVSPKPWEFWIEYDSIWLHYCDCLLRLQGESTGADHEVDIALKMGMKVYYNLRDLPN